MDKKQLLKKFYRNSEIIPECDWKDSLKKNYKELHNNEEDIIDAIIVYCIWNRSTTRIKEADYQSAKDILIQNELIYC